MAKVPLVMYKTSYARFLQLLELAGWSANEVLLQAIPDYLDWLDANPLDILERPEPSLTMPRDVDDMERIYIEVSDELDARLNDAKKRHYLKSNDVASNAVERWISKFPIKDIRTVNAEFINTNELIRLYVPNAVHDLYKETAERYGGTSSFHQKFIHDFIAHRVAHPFGERFADYGAMYEFEDESQASMIQIRISVPMYTILKVLATADRVRFVHFGQAALLHALKQEQKKKQTS